MNALEALILLDGPFSDDTVAFDLIVPLRARSTHPRRIEAVVL